MRFILATVYVAVAFEDALLDEHMHLLQLSARRSVADNLEDDDLDVRDLTAGTPYPVPANKPRFGPDGTWATPYCKRIQGCEPDEVYCPAGCDGAAFWVEHSYANSRLGVPARGKTGKHYLGCHQGRNLGGAVGRFVGPWMNCFNSENATKPAYYDLDPAFVAANIGRLPSYIDAKLQGYGNEFCPDECVNDCALFKLGMFNDCGFTEGRPWRGYSGGSTRDVGPNPACREGVATPFGTSTYLWCGEPTTTTTPAPAVE